MPRHLVFATLTQPHHVRQWYGPCVLTMTVCEIDLSVGGRWRYVLQTPDGSEHAFSGEYLEITPPERLVSNVSFSSGCVVTMPFLYKTRALTCATMSKA